MLQITNTNMQVSFSTKGAEITSILFNGVERTNASKKFWGNSNPTLFPIVGYLINNRYTHLGKSYEMGQHGFSRHSEYKVVEQASNYIVFEHCSDENTWEVFPFDFSLKIKYFLSETNEISVFYEVTNTGVEFFNYALGTHPSFKIDRLDNYEILLDGNYSNKLTIPGDYTMGITKDTFEIDIKDGKFNVNFDLFKYNSAIFKDMEITSSTLLKKDGSEEVVITHGDFNKHLIVWAPTEDADFICVEPEWSLADLAGGPYELADKPYTHAIGPEEVHCYQYAIKFVK